MAGFDPKNYGSKKSKVYSAAPSAGTATVKKDTAASAAVSDYTGGGETFSPSRYGSKKSKLYSTDAKTPTTTQKKSSGGLFEKILQTIGSGALGSASGFAEIVGQATPTTGDQHMGQFSGFGDLGRAVRESRETGADISESVRRMEQARSAKRKASQQRIYETATKLSEESAALREQAKQGAGKVGGFLVDLGATGTQVAGDALANALLPGSGMAMMATRVYGQSAGDARREGKTEGQQFAAGLKGAAIETLTEKLFGGLAKAYGVGTADEVVEKIAEKLTRSDAGKRAATWLINSGGEGVEEVLSDILNPLADRALGLDDGEGRILTADDAAQMGYDFLLGAAMGALGGAGQLRAARDAQSSDNGTLSAAQGAAEAPTATVDPARQNTAERLAEANAAIKETVPAAVDVGPVQTQESSPVQGAGNGRQQVDAPLAPLGVSATQESTSSIPQGAAKYKGLDELLGKAKSGRMSSVDVTDRISTTEEMERLTKELESGAYGMDAADSLYRIKPEEHIDRRERSTVGDRRVKAFQFDHPELHNYFVDAAKRLRYDMDNGQRGGEVYQVPDRDGDWRPRYLRTKRHTTDAVAKLKDDDHLTYDQIYKALEDIIADKGQENYAAAKRVELVLDKMLSEGYTGSDGTYQPDPDYLRRKAAISGARTTAADVDAAESERTWTQRLQDAENGFFEGQTSAERARQDAETALPEDWERRYDGQEPPAVPAATEGGSSPFPAGGKDGLGGADKGSLNSDFQNMQAASSAFHDVNRNAEERLRRERGRAPSEVPEENPNTEQSVTKTVSTILNAPITSNEMTPVLEQSVADGRFDYMPVTDEAAMDKANRVIEMDGGYKRAATRFTVKVEPGQRVTKDDFALGVQCYNEAVAAGDAATALELAGDLSDAAHTGAQVTQAVNLLNRLTPAGKLLTLRRYVDRLNRDGKPKRARKRDSATTDERRTAFVDETASYAIDPQLATDYMLAETDEARNAAWQAIINDIASRVKPTVKEKWDYWRYTSMLTNPVTHVRNLAGNSVQMLMRKTKNAVGAALEAAAVKDTDQRTKALLGRNEADTARRELAKELYEQDKARAMGAGKYKEGSPSGIAREIEDARKMFGEKHKLGKAVQWVGEKNTAALDWGDELFNKPAYIESLAQAMKARGITAEEARRGDKADLMESARAYAAQEAAKATYRDFNDFSDAVTRLNRLRESDNWAVRGLGVAADAVLPFRRTPANILVRGVAEYSPVGLARGVKQAMVDVKAGTKTAAEAIDTLSAGLTGTGIMLLGALLAKNGMLHTDAGDDDREENFLKSIGYQDFALQLGDTSYTLDWMTPAAMPLFAGAAMMESVADDKSLADALMDGLTGIGNVILETSMLSSLDSLMENYQYANSKSWYILTQPIISYLSQGVPTIGGKIANVLDDTARKAYVPKDTGEVSGDISYFWQSLMRKVPGGREALQPSIDVWGQEISNGDLGERLAESFVSPGFISTAKNDAVTKEVRRLAGRMGSTMYPKKADQYFEVDGSKVYLNGDQYTAYAKALGQKRHKLLEDAFKLDGYKAMSDAERAALVSAMYKYANARAKNQVAPAYELTAEMQKYADVEAAGMTPAEWYVLKKSADTDGSGGTSQKEAQAALDKTGLTDREKAALWPLFNKTWDKKNPYI